jgi:murein L,D-transpeptidase YafK
MLGTGWAFRRPIFGIITQGTLTPKGTDTVEGVVRKYGKKAKSRFAPLCQKAKISYPPPRVTLIGLKEEEQLEVWAGNASGPLKKLATYPILAASGTLGPKRQEGDRQVPEGFYTIDVLNPNSSYHLSMRVSYPNQEDLQNRQKPARPMGGDIYIHGDAVSIGCLAMGDPAIEELFTLVALAEPKQRKVLIAPCDLRIKPAPRSKEMWVNRLYERLGREMKKTFS